MRARKDWRKEDMKKRKMLKTESDKCESVSPLSKFVSPHGKVVSALPSLIS